MYLTSCPEEVCYLGHGNKVGHVWLPGGGGPPVYLDIPLLQNRLQFILTYHFLQYKINIKNILPSEI